MHDWSPQPHHSDIVLGSCCVCVLNWQTLWIPIRRTGVRLSNGNQKVMGSILAFHNWHLVNHQYLRQLDITHFWKSSFYLLIECQLSHYHFLFVRERRKNIGYNVHYIHDWIKDGALHPRLGWRWLRLRVNWQMKRIGMQ